MLEGLKAGDPAAIGRFRLLGVLGSGGFGRVFLGQSDDGRQAAVKVMKPELAADPEFRARFAREVTAAARVDGKFTATLVDADADCAEPWLATAYIPGPTLREAVAAQGPFPADSVRALAAGLSEALAAIHAAGLVHRDLKPDNVLLAYDGPRVIDFGIARTTGASSMTATGVLMGTLAFMSPEQVTGATVGPPSDVFSLGSLLVFAATGQGPFGDGTVPQLLYRVAHNTPSVEGVPPEIRPLIESCLAPEPGQRPSARELLAYLSAATPTAGWLARTASVPVPPAVPPRRTGAAGPEGVPGPSDTMPAYPVTGDAFGSPPAGTGRRKALAVVVTAVVVAGLAAAYGVSRLGHHDRAGIATARPSVAASPSAAASRPAAATRSAAAAPQAAAAWSGGHQIATAAALVAISCSSAAFCAAVDSGGSVYTYSGGSWSRPRPLDPADGLSWVSCPADGSCVATSDMSSTLYAYAGGTWTSPRALVGDDGKSAHLTSVSCPSASYCVATGGRDAYTYSGSRWSQGVLLQPGSNKFTAVSCPSTAFCAAVDSGGYVFTYAGGAWSPPRRLNPAGGLSWVSCLTASSCIATSDGGDTVYAYSGSAWKSPPPLVGADGNPAHLRSVSCPTASFCMATGGLNAYAYNGKTWRQGQQVNKGHQFNAVACVSADFCAAVDSGGSVYTYAPPRAGSQ